MEQLTPEQNQIHSQSVIISRKLKRMEFVLIELLQKNDKIKLYKKFNCSSLFQYAVNELALSEPVAYSYISVARASARIPCLHEALGGEGLSVSKASRIVASLNSENASSLIEFAKMHTVTIQLKKRNGRQAASKNPHHSV